MIAQRIKMTIIHRLLNSRPVDDETVAKPRVVVRCKGGMVSIGELIID